MALFGKKPGDVFRITRNKFYITVKQEDDQHISILDGPLTPELIFYFQDYLQLKDPQLPIVHLLPENKIIEKNFMLWTESAYPRSDSRR
jgi:hypothetical protein